MAEHVGGIVWTASIETQQLVNGERQINQSTNRAGRNFDNMERKAAGLNTRLTQLAKTLAGVFAVRQLQRFAMETIRAVDEQNTFAQSISVSYQELQKLQFAAEQNGATINELNNSLRRLTRRTEEAARGTGAAVQAFENLGLNARELERLSPDEIFLRVADAFQQLEGSGKEVSTAFGLFDTEGAKLINTLRRGSAGIRELGNEAERSGRIISQQTAEDAARFNNELNKLQGAAKGAAVSLGAELVPRMTELITTATDWLATGDNVESLIRGIGVVAQTTAAVLAGRLVASIWASIRAMQVATVASRGLAGALAFLGGPVGILAAVATGLALITMNTRRSNDAQTANERTVANLAQRYEDLSDAQLRLLRLDIEQEMRDIEKATEGMTDAFGAAQGKLSGLNTDELQGLGDYLGVEIDTSTQEREAASIARLMERYGELEDALKQLESTYSERRNRASGDNEQAEESIKSITSLAERNEELRAVLSDTSDELEVRRALQAAGVEAGTAEAEVIESLVRGNQDLANAIREAAEAEQRRQELEGVAASDLGLTRLQALKQRYDEEAQLLLAAQEAGIESEVSYQERLNEIYRQYSEERKQIIADETETWKDRLEEMGFSFDALANQGVGALTSVAVGMQDGEDAARSLAQTVLTQALGAMVRYYTQQAIAKVAGDKQEMASEAAKNSAAASGQASVAAAGVAAQSTATSASVAAAATTTAAWTPAAIMASIGSFGAAVGIGLAAMAVISSLTKTSTPKASTNPTLPSSSGGGRFGGGRRNGGSVVPGSFYEVGESNLPELYQQGGRQFLIPGNRGEVVSNRDMRQTNDNSQINLGGITIHAAQMDRERFVNMLFDSENEIYQLMESARAARGES